MKTSQEVPLEKSTETRLTAGELLLVVLLGSIGLNCLLIAIITYLFVKLIEGG